MAKKTAESSKPWFISIPRSGANWIQGMMEIYFQKPRGPIIKASREYSKNFRWVYPENTKFEDLLFVAHHDQKGIDVRPSSSEEGDIFLYRNPMDVVYSNIQRDKRKHRFDYFVSEYKNTFNKWVVEELATLILCYEDFVNDPEQEFKKIVKHFNKEWNEGNFKKAYATVTKQALVNKNPDPRRRDVAFPEMLSNEYSEGRIDFRKKYTELIKERLLTEKTKPWLSRYFEE